MDSLSPLTRKIIAGVLGVLLVPVTNWLIRKGIIVSDDVPKFIAEILSYVIALGGSVWFAQRMQKRENTGIAVSTPAQLDKAMKDGTTAPVFVEPHETPTRKGTGDGGLPPVEPRKDGQ